MSLELYTGYFNLGGNEIINNERTRGILESLDCPVSWFKEDDRCLTVQNAIDPVVLTPWEAAFWNMMPNPSMETPGVGTTEVRRNYVRDPRGVTITGQWAQDGATAASVPDGVEYTITSSTTRIGPVAQLPTNTPVAFRITLQSSIDKTIQFYYRPTSATNTGGQVVLGTIDLVAGVPAVYEAAFTTSGTSPGAGGFMVISTTMTVGSTLRMTKPIAEVGLSVGPYFDGTTSPDPDFAPAWSGAADASPSVLTGVPVASVVGGVQSSAWSADRAKSLRIVPSGATDDTYATLPAPSGGWAPGTAYTILGTVRTAAAQIEPLNARARRIVVRIDAGGTTYLQSEPGLPNGQVEGVQRLTFTVPPGATAVEARLYNGARAGGGDVWWDAVAVIPLMPPLEMYGGSYFDGATPTEPNGLDAYAWSGTPDASFSTHQTRQLIVPPGYEAASVADAPWYDLDIPNISGEFYGAYAISAVSVSDSTRETSVAQSIFNGGTIGRMRLATRSVRIQAMLFAKTSKSLEYGRSWLESATLPGACGQHGTRCGVTDLQFLVDCPPSLDEYPPDGLGYNEDVDMLVRYLHGVEVTSGPFTVSEMKFESNGFLSQVVEFTVTSERAWVYGRTRPVDLPTTESTVVQDTPYNLVPYPSAEIASATDVVVARNLSTNPSVETNATGWTASAAAVSGTAPAAYFTNGRTTELSAVGAASERARILGDGATEVAASVADVVIQQDVAVVAGSRYSFNMWAAALIAAGNAVSSVSDVKVEVEWRTGAATVSTQLIGQAASASERSGRAYSARSLLAPATATIARVKATYRVGWRSSATPANNSDIRLYADALAVTIP